MHGGVAGRQPSGRFVAGGLLLMLLVVGLWIPPLGTTGVARAVTGGLDSAILAWGILLLALPPRFWTDRLFLYQGGIQFEPPSSSP
jgi:hypothetical protein